jgi:hypothetical protein
VESGCVGFFTKDVIVLSGIGGIKHTFGGEGMFFMQHFAVLELHLRLVITVQLGCPLNLFLLKIWWEFSRVKECSW